MLNLWLDELKLIAKSRDIKGYESMFKDRLLSVLNVSESVKESENMPDPTEINKTITEIRKKDCEEDKILEDLRFSFDPEKDHYKLIKTDSAFNNNYVEHESIGDKDKTLTIKEYFDEIKSYLDDIINDHET